MREIVLVARADLVLEDGRTVKPGETFSTYPVEAAVLRYRQQVDFAPRDMVTGANAPPPAMPSPILEQPEAAQRTAGAHAPDPTPYLLIIAAVVKAAVADCRSRVPAVADDARDFLNSRDRVGAWLELIGLDGQVQRRIAALARTPVAKTATPAVAIRQHRPGGDFCQDH